MQANKRRDTAPERALRTILHGRGLRYRVDFPPLKGLRNRADLVFTRARVAVFVDGCFWHGCPAHYVPSKTNVDYWLPKIAANQERDHRVDVALREAGWTVVRVWEHEDPNAVADHIEELVRQMVARSSITSGLH